MYEIKIISNGQSGVSRAVLDISISMGIICEGWCEKNRLTDDGLLDVKYPLREVDGLELGEFYRLNVLKADVSVIIYFGDLEGGAEDTLDHCVQAGKKYLLINSLKIQPNQAAKLIHDFFNKNLPNSINIVGSQIDENPNSYNYAKSVFESFLKLLKDKSNKTKIPRVITKKSRKFKRKKSDIRRQTLNGAAKKRKKIRSQNIGINDIKDKRKGAMPEKKVKTPEIIHLKKNIYFH